MLLSREEAELVFKLHCALMQFVKDQIQGAGVLESAAAYSSLPAEKRQEVVQAFLGRLNLIDAFTAANPAKLTEEELGIVSSWRHLVAGRFIALRQLKKHMVFLPCDARSTAYGVTGLVDPMERVIRKPLPAVVETVLLPFRGKIIYDCCLRTAPLSPLNTTMTSATVGCMTCTSKARRRRNLGWHSLRAWKGSAPARPRTSAELEDTQSISKRWPIRATNGIRKCSIGTVHSTRTRSIPTLPLTSCKKACLTGGRWSEPKTIA